MSRFFSRWLLPPGIKEVFFALPPGFRDLATQMLRIVRQPSAITKPPFLHENARFKNVHAGKRCFVLCTGPSISKENLKPLANEICFSVSNFYKHSDFTVIKPRYHCVPNVLPPHSDETITRWFTEMNEHTLQAALFLGERQKSLIRKQRLFAGRDVSFLCMESQNPIEDASQIDPTRQMPSPWSSPILCISIAVYMGFREIYLLGTDHDWLFKGKYDYFFDRESCVLKDPAVDDKGRLKHIVADLEATLGLWKQYIGLRAIAESKNVKIVNLAQGSFLNVFPFGSLAEVLSR